MIRQIIEIDEEKCDGCGVCIPACKEGALQIIDGKCRLVGDLFCDGLGACIGECPQGAITIIEREAEAYDERKVMETMIKLPSSVLKAHLSHLKEHGAMDFYNEALDFLIEKGLPIPGDEPAKIVPLTIKNKEESGSACGCPGSRAMEIKPKKSESVASTDKQPSELTQWPVQLHLVNPMAPYFRGKDLVIMSTCGPLANANVHQEYLKDRSVVVACPKLDHTEPYVNKLSAIFAAGQVKKVIVVRMEVPCCGGLTSFAYQAAKQCGVEGLTVIEDTLALDGSLKRTDIIFKN